jgi:23S rRNA (uridine2552-2'-O)-methyltransferase
MVRTKSSKRWLKEHFDDGFVKQAKEKGYRARSAFKLLEIQQKDRLIKPDMVIVDLGAAPGGWSQVAIECIKGRGKVFALDILPMDSIENVDFIQGDFQEDEILNILLDRLRDQKVDLVLSDMAPNISGIKAVDQVKVMYLAELALDFAKQVLRPGGNFLVKVFQGEGFDQYLQAMRAYFKKVIVRKPEASRSRSREVYLLGVGSGPPH